MAVLDRIIRATGRERLSRLSGVDCDTFRSCSYVSKESMVVVDESVRRFNGEAMDENGKVRVGINGSQFEADIHAAAFQIGAQESER